MRRRRQSYTRLAVGKRGHTSRDAWSTTSASKMWTFLRFATAAVRWKLPFLLRTIAKTTVSGRVACMRGAVSVLSAKTGGDSTTYQLADVFESNSAGCADDCVRDGHDVRGVERGVLYSEVGRALYWIGAEIMVLALYTL